MERRKEFIVNVAFVAVVFGLIYLGINYVLPIVFPFVLGFLFAVAAKNITKRLFEKDSKLNRSISLLLLYLVLVALFILLIATGVDRIVVFVSNLPTIYRTTISPYLVQFQKVLMNLNNSLPSGISAALSETITDVFAALNTFITTAAGWLVTATTVVIKGAPNVFISIILTIVSSFYMLLDYDVIFESIGKVLPERWKVTLRAIKDFCKDVLFKILGCYVVILLVTFIELFIGFAIFKISNAPLWAFLIAFLDILPVLGVGTVLIPWAVIAIVIGNTVMGVEIAVLYIVITLIRNALEPNLVGTNLGLHPLVTLISMMMGLNVFGVIGMFGFPLTLSFFAHQFKKDSE